MDECKPLGGGDPADLVVKAARLFQTAGGEKLEAGAYTRSLFSST